MQFAFSTLGCPELTVREAAQVAADSGFTALELRCAPDLEVHPGADAQQRSQWREDLAHTGTEALALASYLRVCDPAPTERDFTEEALAHLRLAHDLGACWLRVFPGGPRDSSVPAEQVAALARGRIAELAAVAAGLGVRVGLETHDSHPRVADICPLIEAEESVGVIWDVLHTWLADESPLDSLRLAGDRLAFIQVKDVPGKRDLAPVALGSGGMPLAGITAAIVANGFAGPVSWEYERAWAPQATPLPELASSAHAWLSGRFPTAP